MQKPCPLKYYPRLACLMYYDLKGLKKLTSIKFNMQMWYFTHKQDNDNLCMVADGLTVLIYDTSMRQATQQ